MKQSETKYQQVKIRLTPEEKKQVVIKAQNKGITVSALIRESIKKA